MIRVLQVVTHMNRGGLETMLMNYYRHVNRNEIQFDFLTHRPYDGAYGQEILSLGGKIYHLPRLNPLGVGYQRALKRFFAAHPEYRIVHVHQDCLSGVILKEAKAAGIPVRIAHSHNAAQVKNAKYLLKAVCKRSIPRYATALMACGREAGDFMFGAHPFSVLNNAVDTAAFRFREANRSAVRAEFGVADGDLLIGHVGRFSTQKNHDFLLRCFFALKKIRPDAKLVLVGTGEREAELRSLCQASPFCADVIFAGSRADVNRILSGIDLFLFPSHFEGVPVSLIEAQASGVPCLVSDAVPKESIVTPSVESLSLSASLDTWCDEILRMASTPRRDNLDALRQAGFDVNENADRLVEYYRKALSEEEGSSCPR